MSGHTVNDILVGDAAVTLATLPSASVDMVLTSPPYAGGLRDYGQPGQLGLEATVEQWVTGLETVTHQIGRVLTDTGTFWLNLGDSYSGATRHGAPKKSLLLAPERLALALIDDGWCLRNKIVWHKPNAMPSSVRDRLTSTWEVIYVFTRSPRYYFDLDALRVPHTTRPPQRRDSTGPRRKHAWQGRHGDDGSGLARMKASGRIGHDLGKNPGDVWTIPTSAWRGQHHAVYPVPLIERAITGGCPERVCNTCSTPWRRDIERRLGGVAVRSDLAQRCSCDPATPTRAGIVLDPFMGSGTTAIAAENLGRDWLGIELNPDYAGVAWARIEEERKKRAERQQKEQEGNEQQRHDGEQPRGGTTP